ncbi:hypothetical protein [Streptomyces ardesiacus]|uniref:hypothetical protein n=1 Tax=Streptomyces ardesiacus TaxID=285564 RepID=UPI0036A698D2
MEPDEEYAETDVIPHEQWLYYSRNLSRTYNAEVVDDEVIGDPRSGDHDDPDLPPLPLGLQNPWETGPGSARAVPLYGESDAANNGRGTFRAWWIDDDEPGEGDWRRLIEAATAAASSSNEDPRPNTPLDPEALERRAQETLRTVFAAWPPLGGLESVPLSPEEREKAAWDAANTINHTLARLFVRLGPPPEAAGGMSGPVTSDGGGAQR